MDYDSGGGADPIQELTQAALRHRDTPRRRRKTGPRQVDEDRAAAPGDPGAHIVVDFDNQIIEMVRPPKPVTGRASRHFDRTIVTPVGRVLAPGIVRRDSPHR